MWLEKLIGLTSTNYGDMVVWSGGVVVLSCKICIPTKHAYLRQVQYVHTVLTGLPIIGIVEQQTSFRREILVIPCPDECLILLFGERRQEALLFPFW